MIHHSKKNAELLNNLVQSALQDVLFDSRERASLSFDLKHKIKSLIIKI